MTHPALTALIVASALSLAQAQTSSSRTSAPTNAATPPSTTTTPPATTPASPSPSPTGSAMSNRDAAHALEEAKKACKSEATQQAQQDCVKKAQDDYQAAMKLRSTQPVTPKQ